MEPITIVTVVPEGEGFRLDHPAEDLWIAYEVVRRHVDADGVRHYAQLTDAKMTDEGYEFTFDTGDVFSCVNATDFPASDSVSDASGGGGGGGGVLEVTDEEGTLDYTWSEIAEAVASTGAALVVRDLDDIISAVVIMSCFYDAELGHYTVITAMNDEYVAETTDGYPEIPGIDDLSPVS